METLENMRAYNFFDPGTYMYVQVAIFLKTLMSNITFEGFFIMN